MTNVQAQLKQLPEQVKAQCHQLAETRYIAHGYLHTPQLVYGHLSKIQHIGII